MDASPNIVFVLADQLGARWLPIYGHPLVETPHLESFTAESAVFERAITTSPVCTPYRGCMLYRDPYALLNRQDDSACADVQAQLSQALNRWHSRVAPCKQQGKNSLIPTQSESDQEWQAINI